MVTSRMDLQLMCIGKSQATYFFIFLCHVYNLIFYIYSFGIVLWEIVARKLPFGDMIFLEEIKDAVITGERLEIPENCPSELTDLIKSCWHGLPACRPKFAEVVSRLVGMGADRSSQFDPTRATELDVETETFENVARTECCRRSFEVVTSR